MGNNVKMTSAERAFTVSYKNLKQKTVRANLQHGKIFIVFILTREKILLNKNR